jgi:transcriptional regulator with XRE-family HTH domain
VSGLAESIAAIPGRVYAEMTRRDLSYRDVAAETGLSLSVLYRLVQGSVDPSMSTLVVLARWLDP